ncbi:hypothetical protein M3Y99_00731700 [Aphelenchoides fujianensis]|nr:hypothetical protein M3Y99_00731700 [Aphelenchoides fujianensis]
MNRLLLVALLLIVLAESRLLHVRHYRNRNEIKHILKRTVAILSVKSKQRVIQLMPLDSTATIDTTRVKQRQFVIKTVVGKTKCAVFDGPCFLNNITSVSVVNVYAERDKNGWLDIMRIFENNKKLYEYKE